MAMETQVVHKIGLAQAHIHMYVHIHTHIYTGGQIGSEMRGLVLELFIGLVGHSACEGVPVDVCRRHNCVHDHSAGFIHRTAKRRVGGVSSRVVVHTSQGSHGAVEEFASPSISPAL